MDWTQILDRYGLALGLLIFVCYALWWIIRQALGKDGWACTLAVAALALFKDFLASMKDLQTKLVTLEELQAKRTDKINDTAEKLRAQHDDSIDAGLHACDVAELMCEKLQVDAKLQLASVRENLQKAKTIAP